MKPASNAPDRPVVITGGAGFVGCNLADRLLRDGHRVRILDNLSRAGVEQNLAWLSAQHRDRVEITIADVRQPRHVDRVVDGASMVFHFAAQVAVTTSIERPADDFEVNARGTLNVLEAARSQPEPPPVLFTSTNKVYGGLEEVALERAGDRYVPCDPELRAHGIGEAHPLDFHSPYGCSKGAADQYVIDYARTYGLPAAVFRMSCIYGPRQFGTEDQGWVAHFLLRAAERAPITIYGDGMQVRDVLYVDDLVEALLGAADHIDRVSGQAFNIGGGPASTTSLLELLALIGEIGGAPPEIAFGPARTGDQRYYVSDARRFARLTGWAPQVGLREGVERLHRWIMSARGGARVAPFAAASAP